MDITVKLPTFTTSSNGGKKGEPYSYTIAPDKWTTATVLDLIQQGIDIRVQRATSGMGDNTPEERTEKRDAVVAKIVAGTPGDGSHLSLEDQGIRDALLSVGFTFKRILTGEKTKAGKDATKAESIADAFERYAQAKAKEHGAELDDEAREFLKGQLRETVAYKLTLGIIADQIKTPWGTPEPAADADTEADNADEGEEENEVE